MKALKKKYLLSACLTLSVVAGAAGVATLSPISVNASSLTSDAMQMKAGASLYLDEVSGLKFGYTVENYDANKTYGMLIVPYDYLDDAGITDLTNASNDYVNVLKNATLPNAPIIVEGIAPVDGLFSHSIVGLNEYNYVREFFGIGFEKTGENTYVYAKQNDNVRSVFEVANIALTKLNFGVWGPTEKEVAEKAKLDAYSGNEDGVENTKDDTLDNFITKGFDFVYGEDATVTLNTVATSVDGEVDMPSLAMPEKQKPIDLDVHVNYAFEDDGGAEVSNGKVKGLTRGQSTVTASIGCVINVEGQVAVLENATELELYNNSYKANFFGGEDKTGVEALFGNDGSILLEGTGAASSTHLKGKVGYVAFEDTYTLDEKGTYIDVYFTGNNMPQVEFFASDVLGNIMNDGTSSTGYIVTNGFAAMSSTSGNAGYGGVTTYRSFFKYFVTAANRVSDGHNPGTATEDFGATEYTYNNNPMMYSLFSQYSLRKQSAEQKYRYTVGLYKGADNYMYLDSKLYKVDANNVETLFACTDKKTSVSATSEIKGKIVLHAGFKGSGDFVKNDYYTKFTCSAPYAGRAVKGDAVYNADGTVSLQNGLNDGGSAKIQNTLGYLPLDGEYGLGTYVDFYFTGSNMPQVSFFNEHVTNNLSATYNETAGANSGMMLINDMRYSTTGITQNAYYKFIILPRLTAGLKNNDKKYTDGTDSASASKISASVLETMSTQRFKYTVGFYLGTNNRVWASVSVYKLDENGNVTETYYSLEQSLYYFEKDIKGSQIVVYGSVNGNTNSYTTFSYSMPYTKA